MRAKTYNAIYSMYVRWEGGSLARAERRRPPPAFGVLAGRP